MKAIDHLPPPLVEKVSELLGQQDIQSKAQMDQAMSAVRDACAADGLCLEDSFLAGAVWALLVDNAFRSVSSEASAFFFAGLLGNLFEPQTHNP